MSLLTNIETFAENAAKDVDTALVSQEAIQIYINGITALAPVIEADSNTIESQFEKLAFAFVLRELQSKVTPET
jgi:hypothetical protein